MVKFLNKCFLSTLLICLIQSLNANEKLDATNIPNKNDHILEFKLTQNNSIACLRAKFSLSLDISYLNKYENRANSVIDMEKFDSYTGVCGSKYNTLEITFKPDWSMTLNYTLVQTDKYKAKYFLDSISLKYKIDEKSFPDSKKNFSIQVSEKSGLNQFGANRGDSYKCWSPTVIELDANTKLMFTNFQAQPFITEKTEDFNTAVECQADIVVPAQIVPIIAGVGLPAFIVFAIIGYCIGRRRRYPRYHHV